MLGGTAEFQFLNGAIKRLISFVHFYNNFCFNSLMVRLKGKITVKGIVTLHRFNSLMVRLKESMEQTGTRVSAKFQFLNGAIKSLYIAFDTNININVSIP